MRLGGFILSRVEMFEQRMVRFTQYVLYKKAGETASRDGKGNAHRYNHGRYISCLT